MLLSSRVYRKYRLLVVATLAISALAAGPAFAGRRIRVQRTGLETCSVDPTTMSNDAPGWFSVSGLGFTPGQSLVISLVSPSGGIGTIFTAASDGSFHTGLYYAPYLAEDGQWSASVSQMGDPGMTVLAICSFTVT